MRMKTALVAAAGLSMTAAFGGSAAAQEGRDFLGISLGATPPHECAIEDLGFNMRVYSVTDSTFPCWESPGGSPTGQGLPSSASYSIQILTEPSSKPDGVGRVMAEAINGKVESISVTTKGFTHQDSILQALIAKYGKPDQIDRVPVVTGAGAKFEQIRAIWSGENFHLQFFGLLDTISEGYITVRTDVGQRAFDSKYGSKERTF